MANFKNCSCDISDLIRSAESVILALQLLEVGLHVAQLRVQVPDVLPLLFDGALEKNTSIQEVEEADL